MSTERDIIIPEIERFLGLATLDAARKIVCLKPEILAVRLTPYLHGSGISAQEILLEREHFLSAQDFGEFESAQDEGWDINLNSMVNCTGGRKLHFPMMDLHPAATAENTERIVKALREVIVPEFGRLLLLSSGKSYHILGTELITPEEWSGFLEVFSSISISEERDTSVLMVASSKYPEYCRKQGCLRLTANGKKKVIPTVIAVV